MRIVFIGAHGKVGLLALPLLVSAGHEVTGWVRNPAQVADLEALGARGRVLSIEEAGVEEMAHALGDADAVVFSAGAGGGNPARTVAVDHQAAVRSIDAAKQAGVRRYVMVSYHGAGRVNRVGADNSFFTYQEAKLAADTALRASGLDFTILGPGTLTLQPAPEGVTPASAVQGTLSSTHPGTSRELVARVITRVVDDPLTVGLTLDFHDGPIPLGSWIDAVASGRDAGAEG